MKGIISAITEQQKKDKSGTYLRVQVMSDGKMSELICIDPATQTAVKGNQNKEMEFDTFPSKDGTATFMALPRKSGGKSSYTKRNDAGRDTSFAASYAKDVTVAAIAQGIVKDSVSIDKTLEHYFDLFMNLLKRKE